VVLLNALAKTKDAALVLSMPMPAAIDMVLDEPAVESVRPDRYERGAAESTEPLANRKPASEIAVVIN
jgi:hypothetical protein